MEPGPLITQCKWVKIEVRKEIKNLLKLNENENTAYPNLRDMMRAI